MICVECRQRHHEGCPGGNWCDCQHQPSPEAQEYEAESAMSWVRQGLAPTAAGGTGRQGPPGDNWAAKLSYIFNADGGIGTLDTRLALI